LSATTIRVVSFWHLVTRIIEMPKTIKPSEDREQAAAFRKAARELGAEATDEQFQGALRKIARHKPVSKPKNETDDPSD
jgi:hypothetical protein